MGGRQKHYEITATIYDRRGRVLSVGKNSYTKTHPIMAKFCHLVSPHKLFLHAEVAAIAKCKTRRLLHRAHRIVVERYNVDGTPAFCQPCPICMAAIKILTPIQVIEHT